MKHTFLDQFCLPDDVSNVTMIVFSLTYRTNLRYATVWERANKANANSKMVENAYPIRIVTWMDVLDIRAKSIGTIMIVNNTHHSIRILGAECVEFRYFGPLPVYQRVDMIFSGEIWWMGKKE